MRFLSLDGTFLLPHLSFYGVFCTYDRALLTSGRLVFVWARLKKRTLKRPDTLHAPVTITTRPRNAGVSHNRRSTRVATASSHPTNLEQHMKSAEVRSQVHRIAKQGGPRTSAARRRDVRTRQRQRPQQRSISSTSGAVGVGVSLSALSKYFA